MTVHTRSNMYVTMLVPHYWRISDTYIMNISLLTHRQRLNKLNI